MKRTRRIAILAAAVCIVPGGSADAAAHCDLAPSGTADVAVVRDGRTLLLADGREFRLAAIEVSPESRAAVEAAIARRPLQLLQLGPASSDRYGRPVGFARAGDETQTLQEILLREGYARVSARVGDTACAEALLALERAARAARLGLWADPNFAPLKAEDFGGLKAERGQFVLVEGQVLSVRESGATTYINFARHWTSGFSITILKRLARSFAAAGIVPKQLRGRRIRVRGWLEQRRGPIIDVTRPEQIEPAEFE